MAFLLLLNITTRPPSNKSSPLPVKVTGTTSTLKVFIVKRPVLSDKALNNKISRFFHLKTLMITKVLSVMEITIR